MRRAVLLAWVASIAFTTACGAAEPGPGPAPLDCGVASPVFDARGDVVQGESDAGCVRIERKTISLGEDVICKACPYEATALVVRMHGNDANVAFELRDELASDDRDDLGALTYEASHHNWADVVTAHGDGVDVPTAFAVRILYDVDGGGWDLKVTRDGDDDNAVVLPVVGSR